MEQDGELSKHGGDSKVASTKIKISNEISLEELIQAAMDKSGESEIYSVNTGDHTVTVKFARNCSTLSDDTQSAIGVISPKRTRL